MDDLETVKDAAKVSGPIVGVLGIIAFGMKLLGLKVTSAKEREEEQEVSKEAPRSDMQTVEALLERIDRKLDKLHDDISQSQGNIKVIERDVEELKKEVEKLRVLTHDLDKLVAGLVKAGIERTSSGEHKMHVPYKGEGNG